ncbi:MAG: hypothetical protein VXW41_09935, partial [SAR324 cluster bacterium]|nr:hypothetical protein [SAR324 cluster bacterium]
MTTNRHNGLVTNHGSVGNSTPIDQDTASYAYRGNVRYFDGSPVADPSSYTANTLENWNLTSSNTNTSHLIYTGTPSLYLDGGLLYRATGLSLPTNRSIVITDRMVDYQKPTQSSAFPKIKNNFSTKGSRATDGFSKRTEVYNSMGQLNYAENLIKTEPAPLEHPTGLTITDSTPTSVTMSWTAGAVDNYTLFYDNASRIGNTTSRLYGWFHRSSSFGTGTIPLVWDWDNSSFYTGTPKLPQNCTPRGTGESYCIQRDFADFRREGISGNSTTVTGLTEGVRDLLLKTSHSQQLGFWPYPYADFTRDNLTYQRTFGAETVITAPSGTAV